MFENVNMKGVAFVAIFVAITYLLFRRYMKSNEHNTNLVTEHNNSTNDGFNDVLEEREHGLDEEYRTNDFSPNFLNDMDRAGVFDLQ